MKYVACLFLVLSTFTACDESQPGDECSLPDHPPPCYHGQIRILGSEPVCFEAMDRDGDPCGDGVCSAGTCIPRSKPDAGGWDY